MRGAVLAGGAASRFGGKPKGLELVGGERIVDRAARVVRAATGAPPALIANAPGAGEWCAGLQVVKDIIPECGTLSGLYTAVSQGDDPVLVVAWDMPFLPVELLEAVVKQAGDYDAFLPESTGPLGVEPLCAVYGPKCREPIRSALENEDYRSTAFHDAINVGTLPLAEIEKHGDPEVMFFNVNTPTELRKAEELWRTLHG